MAATIASASPTVVTAAVAAGGEPAPADGAPQYAGLTTRALGLVIDAIAVQVVALVVAMSVIVVLGLLHLPHNVEKLVGVIGGVVYVLWSIGYFVGFWSATGQTPGARVMQVRVTAAEGGELSPFRAFVRCVGLVLAALPLFAGYAPILFDSRRRGLQDWLARTVVVQTSQLSIAAAHMRPPRGAGADPPRS
jgi:uncharacterized RDD family membrane protein YckC